ncbi:MAG TPA: OmpA family protein [Pirellulales bacterium]|nr:OmpA family protein [Pirellulales bacterium]
MRLVVRARALGAAAPFALAALVAVAGCAQNPYVVQGQLQTLQQEHAALTQRYNELQSRMTPLDQDNAEQHTLLAQSQQQRRVLEEQVAALREQLATVTSQLARSRDVQQAVEKKAETLAASVKRRVGATITANNSLQERLPAVEIPGVEVRIDGDVIRIELPGRQLFESGNARLLPQAPTLIDRVAAELTKTYPDQVIGVEGYTDSDPIRSNKWSNNHHLSTARAMAVYDYLTTHTRLQPSQLFVVGHGSNHPVVSNGTTAGKERNRRVELVVYPDRAVGRP